MKGAKNYLLKTFVVGLVIMAPIALTFWLVKLIFQLFDGLLHGVLQYLPHVPDVLGVGMAFVVVIVFLAGLVGRNVIGKKVVHIGQQILLRFPVFNLIYSPTKQMVESFSTGQEKSGLKVMLIEPARKGVWSAGIEARKIKIDGRWFSIVLLPTPPTFQPGPPIFIPVEEVLETDWAIDDFAKFIAFFGRVGRNEITTSVEKTPKD